MQQILLFSILLVSGSLMAQFPYSAEKPSAFYNLDEAGKSPNLEWPFSPIPEDENLTSSRIDIDEFDSMPILVPNINRERHIDLFLKPEEQMPNPLIDQ